MKITWDVYKYKTVPKVILGTPLEKGLLSLLSIVENGVAGEKNNY